MFGKFFASTFTGSMFGAGPDVFAVWGYVIAHTVAGEIELNPLVIGAAIGMAPERVDAALDFLKAPDPKSRNKEYDGRRLIQRGEYAYFVPSHQKYRNIRSEEDRRAYNREAQRKYRAKKAESVNTPVNDSQSQSSVSAHTEADTEAEAENNETRREQTDYERLVAAKFNGSWHLVDGFLKGKAPNKREAWVKAIASLAMDYGEPLVAQACNDASAAPDPVRMPAALRSICAGLRESGIRAARSSTDPVNGSPRKSATGDAALIYGQIAGLVKQTQQPGQAVRRFIPRAMVAQLGDDVLRAYEAIGGAERVLAAEGDKVGFVIRDFTAALEAARA